MASKKRPEKEPLYRSQEEMLTHIQNMKIQKKEMTMGREEMQKAKAALKGHLRSIKKRRTNEDIALAILEKLANELKDIIEIKKV